MSKNIVGTRLGLYDVIYECDTKAKDGHRLYHVKCSVCGFETNMTKSHIHKAKVCNHLNVYTGRYIYSGTYKWKNKRIGNIFRGMRARCYNPNDESYQWYGDKGIKICDEWLDNPLAFENWALNNGYDDNLTIDRIDENKDYSPENCRWVTLANNAKYKSTTRVIKVKDNAYTGKDWAKKLNLSTNLINNYFVKYGENDTKKFINRRLSALPIERSNNDPTYFDLYMNQVDDDGFIKLIPKKK